MNYTTFKRMGWGTCKQGGMNYTCYDLFTDGKTWLLLANGAGNTYQIKTVEQVKERHFVALNSNGCPPEFTVGKYVNKDTSHESLMDFAAVFSVEGINL